ncbi:ethanolamine utilization microcompartment protein EutL [Tessaracoccus sp. SD287]|uniref:ethanolamine utilization microcompartment protein EutL n=1 Tax=Tessaracoccus sp. SD287 TaxID=2782008 RepID=UPI001A95BF36|nr:ethanolamine utilization microcompartment protein EutL [Tessaracoccus sp. SD287]MBO1032016.1 ethanolamine utilization microcompartment protein EutL [Tessaracoccus sp. SD287]
MAILDPIKPTILAARTISNVDRGFATHLRLGDQHRALGLVTCDIDDALYVALDEATKFAEVEVVYAKSFYAGSGYPSGPLSGEIIGILAGPTPAEVTAGLDACIAHCEQEAFFYSADEAGDLTFFPHVVSSTGSFLSKEAGIAQGEPLAYLIAPPLEATYALDAALKAAAVEMKVFYEPPSETNFGGGLLTGSHSACRAAAAAFTDAVLDVARNPRTY